MGLSCCLTFFELALARIQKVVGATERVFDLLDEVPENINSTPNPERLKEALRLFKYPRQEGASSLFSSEMWEDGGNMD